MPRCGPVESDKQTSDDVSAAIMDPMQRHGDHVQISLAHVDSGPCLNQVMMRQPEFRSLQNAVNLGRVASFVVLQIVALSAVSNESS